jgi:hypothetical protein
MFDSVFGKKPPQKGGPLTWEPTRRSPLSQNNSQGRSQSFAKVFRWRLPDGHTVAPASVEIVGSFTQWQKVPLTRDGALDAWHVTLHNIPSHQTHHYMLLVDGKPTQDKNCDGLAIPRGPEEERYTLATDRGPRVFMLFAQTK